ncbi:MAG: hypothetical protein LBH91_08345 [Prevotellaceae bacterium]|jgi:hypothetical protein|nr:hypothetical protein [Prevotellaceae bacterium]
MKRKILLFIIALVPAVIGLTYICNYGVSVPFLDEWEMVAFSQQMETGGLQFSDLYAQHNEHRILFARLAYLAIVSLTNYNTVALMLFSFLMISLSTFLIVNYIGRRYAVPFNKCCLFAAVISFLTYSLAQYENLLWGFQIGFNMVLLLSVLSFYFLYLSFEAKEAKRRWFFLGLALVFAVIDSFSHSQGLITWITAAILMLLIFRRKVLKSPYFLAWCGMAILTWGIYFYQYAKPEHHPSLTYLLDEPVVFIQYFLSILGNSIAGSLQSMVVVFGLFILFFFFVAVTIIWKRKQLSSYFFPIALTLNSLFILGSIALGRAGFGVEQSLASRYVSFSLYAVIGLCLLWMELKDLRTTKNVVKKTAKITVKEKNIIKNTAKVIVGIIIFTIPFNLYEGIRKGGEMKKDREYSVYLLSTIDQQPNRLLQRMYPWPDKLRERAVYLQEHKLNVFHANQYEVPALLFNDSLAQKNNDILTFDPNTIQSLDDFWVILRPLVKPQYRKEVANLYVDVNGVVFPIYTAPDRHNKPADYNMIYDISAISLNILPQELLQVKFKALSADASFYYEIDPDWKYQRSQ